MYSKTAQLKQPKKKVLGHAVKKKSLGQFSLGNLPSLVSVNTNNIKINYESALFDPRGGGKSWAAVLKKNSQGRVERDWVRISSPIWRTIKIQPKTDDPNKPKTEDEKEKEPKAKNVSLMKFTFSGNYPIGTVLEISQGGRRSYQAVTPQGLKPLGLITNPEAEKQAASALGLGSSYLVWA